MTRINHCLSRRRRVRPGQPVFAAMLTLILALGVLEETRAAVPKAGDAYDVKLAIDDKPLTIRFRYCPEGSLKPGPPKPPEAGAEPAESNPPAGGIAALLAKGNQVQFKGFYLAETELTITQVAALLGEQRFGIYRKSARTILGTGEAAKPNEYLIEAVAQGVSDLPAFAVSFADVIFICRRLNELTANPGDAAALSLESGRFRLPSHAEWQYACRAAAKPGDEQATPHFSNWVPVDALDAQFRADFEEEKTRRGSPTFTGSQFEIAELLEKATSNDRKKYLSPLPLRVLSALLQEALKVHDIADPNPARLVASSTGQKNSWGLAHMHDNVNEWTVTVNQPDQLLETWDELAAESSPATLGSQEILFLAGGHNFNSAFSPGRWKQLTIWGGYPMDYSTGQIQPFSVDRGRDDELSLDQAPGLRLLFERVLREGWFAVVRQTVSKPGQPAAATQPSFDAFRQTVGEIVPSATAPRIIATIGFYNALALCRSPQADDRVRGRKLLNQASADLGKQYAAKSTPAGGLAALLNQRQNSNDNKPKQANPDELYFRLLGAQVAGDADVAAPQAE